jgi:hypothetical protein
MLQLAFAPPLSTLATTAQNLTFREAPRSESIRASKVTLDAPVQHAFVPVQNAIVKPLSGQYEAKKIMLLLAATLIGLAYAVLLPIAGLITLAWVAGGAYLPSSQLGKCRLMWAKHSHYFRPRLSA